MSNILEFWNMSDDKINDILLHKNPTSKSTNIKIKLLTCIDHNSLCDFESKMLKDGLLIEILESLDGKFHDNVILLKAVQQYALIKPIENLRNERKISNIEEEDQLCPLDIDDNSSYYGINPITGDEELLSAKYIFLENGHCYDENSIYKYLSLGGYVSLSEQYIKKYFKTFECLKYSFQGLSFLSDDYTNSKIRSVLLENNFITSTNNLRLPRNVVILSLDGNPLHNNVFLDTYHELKLLSLKNCSITTLNCNYLSSSITELDLSDNIMLAELKNINKLTSLNHLIIKNTKINSLDCSNFRRIRNNKLIIYCDKKLTLLNNQDWIFLKTK